jgi:acetone monooxygenase
MLTNSLPESADMPNKRTIELDALIIGAGVAGLYQLHQLRVAGLRALAMDTADDIGGI